jgi:hypothetical protein
VIATARRQRRISADVRLLPAAQECGDLQIVLFEHHHVPVAADAVIGELTNEFLTPA